MGYYPVCWGGGPRVLPLVQSPSTQSAAQDLVFVRHLLPRGRIDRPQSRRRKSDSGLLAGTGESAMFENMKSKHAETRSVNVTGLSEEAIRAVESLVAALREQGKARRADRSPEDRPRAV